MKTILIIDIPDNVDLKDIQINWHMLETEKHFPYSQRTIAVGGVINHKMFPQKKEYRQDKAIYDYQNGYVDGWNECLKEIGGGNGRL